MLRGALFLVLGDEDFYDVPIITPDVALIYASENTIYFTQNYVLLN